MGKHDGLRPARRVRGGMDGHQFAAIKLAETSIPPVDAEAVRRAAMAVADYGHREGLDSDAVVELLHMLRINADTMEHGLLPWSASETEGQEIVGAAGSESRQLHSFDVDGEVA